MGFKRPFDDEKSHELLLKHPRQFGYNDKSCQFREFIPHHDVSPKSVVTVNEGDHCKPLEGESSDGETFDEESNFESPVHNVDGSFTWVTEGCDGKDATRFPHSEFGVAPRVCPPVETLYSFLLDQPPRKQVSIGPGHQAIIPEWEGSLEPSGTPVKNDIVGCVDDEKWLGTCIVPMPDLNSPVGIDCMVGKGREFCLCEDMGSIRCVRQHIKEAREGLVKTLGFEKFRDLGFCDMGEEVSQGWSDEEALLFHQVVYSNPVTLGRDFWKHLEAAFYTRTMNEIVSYYFNVFILRRRATQNRTLMLDIDSDDDEWHGGYGGHLGIRYIEEDEENSHPEFQEESEEDASDCQDDNEDDYVDSGEGGSGLHEEQKMNRAGEYMDTFSESNEVGRMNAEDDSCTSFELTGDAVNTGWTNFGKKDETGLEEHQKNPMQPTNGKDLEPTGAVWRRYLVTDLGKKGQKQVR